MTAILDNSIDMILCDLPYGTTQNKWDRVIPLAALWDTYRRICKTDGAIVLTAAQPFTSLLVLHALTCFKQELIWCKNVASEFLNANRRHMRKHESVLLFSAGSPVYNPQRSVGKAYIKRRDADDTGSNYGDINKRTDTVNDGSRAATTLLDFARETGFHPTQKPVALFEYLIKTYSNPGDKVLDNCAGSFTTAIAAENTGRRWICIEQDENYFNVGVDRVTKHLVK